MTERPLRPKGLAPANGRRSADAGTTHVDRPYAEPRRVNTGREITRATVVMPRRRRRRHRRLGDAVDCHTQPAQNVERMFID